MSDVVLGHPHGRPFYWFMAGISTVFAIGFAFQATGITGANGWLLPASAAVVAICTLAAWQAVERLFHPGRAFARSVGLPGATRGKLQLISNIAMGLALAMLVGGYSLTWSGNGAWKATGQDLRALFLVFWLLQVFLDDLTGKRRA